MKRASIILGFALIGSLAACGDNKVNNGNNGNNGADGAPGADGPDHDGAMPELGSVQLDRVGRPLITTALQETFDPDQVLRQQAIDAYNQDADPDTWATSYTGAAPANPGEYGSGFHGTLAIHDAFDADCGNQVAFDTGYQELADMLATDRLVVNSASGDCSIGYLAVELDALGVLPNTDCGGRTLVNDVVDTSYSVFMAGTWAGVTDNVPTNDVPFEDNFPYLAPPQ